MVRVASRLGLKRQARDVTPSLADYLAGRVQEQDATDGEAAGNLPEAAEDRPDDEAGA
jgi:hypothetical protein